MLSVDRPQGALHASGLYPMLVLLGMCLCLQLRSDSRGSGIWEAHDQALSDHAEDWLNCRCIKI